MTNDASGERSTPSTSAGDELAGIRRGRPRVGARRGESPVVKGRVTPDEFAVLKEIMEATGRSQAELVRRGVQLVIAEHGDKAKS